MADGLSDGKSPFKELGGISPLSFWAWQKNQIDSKPDNFCVALFKSCLIVMEPVHTTIGIGLFVALIYYFAWELDKCS
jgi:hypothetical protein